MIRHLAAVVLAAVVAMPAVSEQRKYEPQKKIRIDPRLLEAARLYELRESQGIGLSPKAREIARQRTAAPDRKIPMSPGISQAIDRHNANRAQSRPTSGMHTRTQAGRDVSPAARQMVREAASLQQAREKFRSQSLSGMHTRTHAPGTPPPANAITAQARRTTATPGQHQPMPQNRMPASRPMPQNRSQLQHR